MKRSRSASPPPPPAATTESTADDIRDEDKCWKCQGHGRKRAAGNSKEFTGKTCPVCLGNGKRPASKRSLELAEQPGKIIRLRGRDGYFVGQRALQNHRLETESNDSIVQKGEILAALGCGDWRIFQLANGHKLTVDDFLCAWMASEEMRKRGYGLAKEGIFGQLEGSNNKIFHHADIGCGCGSVLMTLAWAFPKVIRSHGVEAQAISYDLCRRGLLWNLGEDGSDPSHAVQLSHDDLRSWSGGSLVPFDLITGTPPYFPANRFVASENHSQKIRCRIPTRGAAADYVAAAARLIKSEGVICIAETARKEGEDGMIQAIQEHGLKVLKRLDVITRTGLPPRFSCWLLTKPAKRKETKDKCEHVDTINDLETLDKSTGEKDAALDFLVETLTIRNSDKSRTLEYVDAMEKMGWVDFERTRENMEETNIDK